MFGALLESMGYTVDSVSTEDAYRAKLKSVDYTYSFTDASFLADNQDILDLLHKKQVKNIAFVTGPLGGETPINLEDFDLLIPSIADRSLLRFYLSKL